MISTKNRMRLCNSLLVCLLAFIWGNSLMPAHISQAFSDWVKALLSQLFTGEGSPEGGSGLLRKIAHFTEFTALGMCLCWRMGMKNAPPARGFALGAAVACVDETIQMFVPGRGPGIGDVLLDCSGVAAGIALLSLGHHYYRKKQHHYGGT